MLYALQCAVAALGHCDPRVRTGYNHAPGIDGTDPRWAAWVQHWHDTSTLTPKVRATVRTIMAKARPVAGHRTSRDHRARTVDESDVRRMGRSHRPHEGR
jgi:hypothetical protein